MLDARPAIADLGGQPTRRRAGRPLDGSTPTALVILRVFERHQRRPDGQCRACGSPECLAGTRALNYLRACGYNRTRPGGGYTENPAARSTSEDPQMHSTLDQAPAGHDLYLLRGLLHCALCLTPMIADWCEQGRGYRCVATCRQMWVKADTVEADVVAVVAFRHRESQAALADPTRRTLVLREHLTRVLVGSEHRLTTCWRRT